MEGERIDGSPELMSIHAIIRGAQCHLYPMRPFCYFTHSNMIQCPPLEGGLESWAAKEDFAGNVGLPKAQGAQRNANPCSISWTAALIRKLTPLQCKKQQKAAQSVVRQQVDCETSRLCKLEAS